MSETHQGNNRILKSATKKGKNLFKARSLASVVLVLAAMMTWPQPARGGISGTPTPGTWVTNGQVNAIVTDGNITYIAGDFGHVGPATGHGVPIDGATGLPVTRYPKVNGSVLAVAPDGAGGWYVGGAFTMVGELERNNIAHILSAGIVDPAWNPNASGFIRVLVVRDGTVYAGGDFTTIAGQSRNHIAALDASTGNATSWNPNASGWVKTLAVSDGTVYAGGGFTRIGGKSRRYIAALDASTGKATRWNPKLA